MNATTDTFTSGNWPTRRLQQLKPKLPYIKFYLGRDLMTRTGLKFSLCWKPDYQAKEGCYPWHHIIEFSIRWFFYSYHTPKKTK